jgi:fibronectin-binding autotransporter adhesin
MSQITSRTVRVRCTLAAAAALALAANGSIAATYTWQAGSTGTWSDVTKWSSSSYPNAINDVAQNTASSGTGVVTLDVSPTIGTLQNTNQGSWQILASGSNGLTFDVSAGSATLASTSRGTLTVNAPITISDPLNITASSSNGGGLVVGGAIGGTGDISATLGNTGGSATQMTFNGAINNAGSFSFNITSTNTSAVIGGGVGANVTSFTKTGVGTLNLRGSELRINGNSTTSGPFQIQRAATISVAAGQNLSLETLSVPAGANLLLRAPDLGSAPGAGVGSVFITNPTLSGAGTGSGAETKTLSHVIGDTSITGTGTGFVTYDATNGVRLLTASEYSSSLAANSNVKLSSSVASSVLTINSLTLDTGAAITGSNAITITSGDILINGTPSANINAPLTSSTGRGLNFIAFADATFSGNVASVANVPITKNGTGTVTLSASPTNATGAIVVNGGTLRLTGGTNNNWGSGGVTVNAGSFELTGSNRLSDSAAVSVNSGATLNYQGVTKDTISTLSGSGIVTGGTGIGGGGPAELDLAAGGGTPTFSGQLTGNLKVTKRGNHTWTISGTSNDYTGATTVNGGVLAIGASGALPSSTDLVLTSGTFDLNDYNQTVGRISGSAAITGPGTLTVNGSTDGTYSGAAIGLSGLIKSGTSKLTISGTGNTYGGATQITGGQLIVNGSIANSAVTITGGSLGGSGTVGSIAGGAGSVNPGNSSGILTAASVNGADVDYNFEFTAVGNPTYSSATASVNDVLRLTGVTPFVNPLGAGNVISVYLDDAVDGVGQGDIFVGGFYADQLTSFDSAIANATFAFYQKDSLGTVAYGGANYSLLALPVTVTTIAQSANFGGGAVNGSVTQFTVVPEPATLSLLALACLPMMRRRRA